MSRDDYKRAGRGAHAWGSKERKADSRQRKSALRRVTEPTEPDVHPAEIDELAFQANCKHPAIEDGYCLVCWRPDPWRW